MLSTMVENIKLQDLRSRPPAPPTPENEVNQNPNPHQRLPCPVVEDFDAVSTINSWARLEKNPSKRFSVFFSFILDIVMFCMEVYFLVSIYFHREGVRDLAVFELERNITFWVLVVTSALNLMGKLLLDGSVRSWYPLSLIEVLKFFGMCQMHLTRPIRYMRTVRYWFIKNKIIGKKFVHGETVTKEEVLKVTEINKDELIIARDDLYETFIQGIPMALLQCYLFINVASPLKVCNARDGCRLLYMILQLLQSVKCIMIYEWRKRVYAYSLHVQGYLFTNGRFPVPDCLEDLVTIGLKIIIHTLSVFARFLLIGYMSGIHWTVGATCAWLLFAGNCMAMFISPSALSSTIQNLPVGVSIPASYLTDHWINVFTVKDTRFYELTREPIRTRSGREVRFPLIIAQVLPFLLTFSVLYTSTVMFQLDKLDTPGAVIRLFKNTTCPHHNPVIHTFDFYDYVSTSLYHLSRSLRTCFRPGGGVIGFISLHCILLYIQIVIVLTYACYLNKFFETLDTCYPVLLTCRFIKKMIRTINGISLRDNFLKLSMLKRLVFLISIDLPTFNKTYMAYHRLSPKKDDPFKWWDEQILAELENKDPVRVSHRQFGGPTLDITGTPISSELEEALQLMQNDVLSFRLFLYCTRRFERVFSCEMTATRLTKSFSLLGLSRRGLCVETPEDPLVEQSLDIDFEEE